MMAERGDAQSGGSLSDDEFGRCVEAARGLKSTGDLVAFIRADGGLEFAVDEDRLAEAADQHNVKGATLARVLQHELAVLLFSAAMGLAAEQIAPMLGIGLGDEEADAAQRAALGARQELVRDALLDDQIREYAQAKVDSEEPGLVGLSWSLMRPVRAGSELGPPIARLVWETQRPIRGMAGGGPPGLGRVVAALAGRPISSLEIFCHLNDLRYIIRRLNVVEGRLAEAGGDEV